MLTHLYFYSTLMDDIVNVNDAAFPTWLPLCFVLVPRIQSVSRDIGHGGAVWIDVGTLRQQMHLASRRSSFETMVG